MNRLHVARDSFMESEDPETCARIYLPWALDIALAEIYSTSL